MKTFFLALLTFFLLTSCSKDDNKVVVDKAFQLPAETQTGANTFGVTIRGKVYITWDPTSFNVGSSGRGMKFAGSSILPWNEIVVIDGASPVSFQMIIHFKELLVGAIGIYTLKNSNYQNGLDSSLGKQVANNNVYKTYSNPSNEIVNIDLREENNLPEKGATISGELFDMMGQSRTKVDIKDNKTVFSVLGLPRGIYVLKIYINDQFESHQIAVE